MAASNQKVTDALKDATDRLAVIGSLIRLEAYDTALRKTKHLTKATDRLTEVLKHTS